MDRLQQRALCNNRYESLGDRWDFGMSHESRLFHRWLRLNLPPDTGSSPRILDLGGGPGRLARELQHSEAPDGYFYVDFEMSDAAAAVFRRHELQHFVHGVIPETGSLPFKDKCFDLVHCSHVVEHLVNPDIMFSESYRLLRPGGFLFVSTPNLASWIGRIMVLCGWQGYGQEISTQFGLAGKGPLGRLAYGEGGINYHLRVFTLAGLTDMMRLHGFEILQCRGAQLIGGGSGDGIGRRLVSLAASMDGIASVVPSLATNILCFGRKPPWLLGFTRPGCDTSASPVLPPTLAGA